MHVMSQLHIDFKKTFASKQLCLIPVFHEHFTHLYMRKKVKTHGKNDFENIPLKKLIFQIFMLPLGMVHLFVTALIA